MYKKSIRFVRAAFLLAGLMAPGLSSGGEFAVVVNASVKQAGDAAAQELVGRLYLKQLAQWPDGTAARVFAGKPDAPEMAAFRAKVLKMNESALAAHWLSVKQKTGETPPREVAAGNLLLKLVAQYPGALGIVPVAQYDGADGKTRVLFEF